MARLEEHDVVAFERAVVLAHRLGRLPRVVPLALQISAACHFPITSTNHVVQMRSELPLCAIAFDGLSAFANGFNRTHRGDLILAKQIRRCGRINSLILLDHRYVIIYSSDEGLRAS